MRVFAVLLINICLHICSQPSGGGDIGHTKRQHLSAKKKKTTSSDSKSSANTTVSLYLCSKYHTYTNMHAHVRVQHSFLQLVKSEFVYLSNSTVIWAGRTECWALESCCDDAYDRSGVNTYIPVHTAPQRCACAMCCYMLHAERLFVAASAAAAKALNKHANTYAFYFSIFLLASLLFCF